MPLKGSIENQLINIKFSMFSPSGDKGAENIENLLDFYKLDSKKDCYC
jgi:hypothetical protein